MKKVTAVGTYGNVAVTEDKTKLHNDLVYEMFKEVLEPMQQEKVKGDLIQYWSNAGLITQYLGTMFYLEDIKESETVNSVVCIIPKNVSNSQLNYFEDNYLNSIDTFIGIYFDGEEFKLLENNYNDSNELYNFLEEAIKTKGIS